MEDLTLPMEEAPKKPRKKVVKKRPTLVVYEVTPKNYDRLTGETTELPGFSVKLRWAQDQKQMIRDNQGNKYSKIESNLTAKYGTSNVKRIEI